MSDFHKQQSYKKKYGLAVSWKKLELDDQLLERTQQLIKKKLSQSGGQQSAGKQTMKG